jgi:hypothetical protein
MENPRLTANDARQIAKDNVINNLQPQHKEGYYIIINKIKEISQNGIRYWVVNKDNEYYKYLYTSVLNILSDDGFTIVDNYADEEFDYEYFGKVINW